MRIILLLSYLIFFIGLIVKFFHIHFNAIIMMVGLFLMFLYYIISAIKKKVDVLQIVSGFAVVFWLTALLFTIKFFPFQIVVLTIAILLSVIAIVFAIKRKVFNQLIFLALSALFCVYLFLMPSDEKYYLLNVKWNYEIDTDFFTWDKYSWFLYQNDKFDAAVKASNKALKIVKSTQNDELIDFISTHNTKLLDNNWKNYQ